MTNRFIAAAAVVATLLVPIAAISAVQGVQLRNVSDSCALISVFASTNGSPLKLVESPKSVRPRESAYFDMPLQQKFTNVQVRAEIKKNADCSGNTVADIHTYVKGYISGTDNLAAKVWNTGSEYRVELSAPGPGHIILEK